MLCAGQDAATRFRFNYYLRRYDASECDARLLHVAAEWISALLTAGLPLDHGMQLPSYLHLLLSHSPTTLPGQTKAFTCPKPNGPLSCTPEAFHLQAHHCVALLHEGSGQRLLLYDS